MVSGDRPHFFPVRDARDAALQEDLVHRHVHEIVHHLHPAAPDGVQREAVAEGDDLNDPDVDRDLDYEQQLFSEDDDGGFPADVPPGIQQPQSEPIGLQTTAQQRRRRRDDEAYWPARRGSSRPPHVHPEVW